MVLALIAIAVGDELAIAHPGDDATLGFTRLTYRAVGGAGSTRSAAYACQEQPIVSAARLRLAREARTRLAIVAAALVSFRDDSRQG